MSKLKTYWTSWEQPTEDYRPLTFPPNEGILGWWCSGKGENYATLCAVIAAENEEDAINIVKKDWPEWIQWRFMNENSEIDLGDRFVVEADSWMIDRLNTYNIKFKVV